MEGPERIRWNRILIICGTVMAVAFLWFANLDPGGLGWTAEVWASWVQAVGSVVAIIAAAWISQWQNSRDRIQKVKSLTGLASFAADAADSFQREVARYRKNPVARAVNVDHLRVSMNAFAVIPVHELPDDRLIYPAMALVDGTREILEFAEALNNAYFSTGAAMSQAVADRVEILAGRIDAEYGAVVEVERDLAPVSLAYTWRTRHLRARK